MPEDIPIESFPELLELPGLAHGFVCRQRGVGVSLDRDQTLANLHDGFCAAIEQLGIDPLQVASAEQVHGGEVVAVESPGQVDGVDGLITDTRGLGLRIVVADCCAVFLVDPVPRAIGLVHSGKKGTDAGIAATAIRAMQSAYGCRPADLRVRLSPCIRPPAYEVDFAAAIRAQVAEAGVLPGSIFDDGVCTASHLDRYYSYRAEKGATGRMLAVLGLL